MQFFQNLPQPVKIVLSLAIFLLVGIVSVDKIPNLFANNPEEKEQKQIDLSLVIRDDDNNPLEGVDVSFQGTGAVESRRTDTNGYVSINLPERQDIEIVMRKEGFKTKRQIMNLTIDSEKTVTYYLESEVKSNSYLQPEINQTIADVSLQEKCQQNVPLNEFIFKIEKCERTGATLIIYLTIENIGRPRNLAIYSGHTRIIDDVGNDNYASKVYIGQSGWNNSSRIRLPHESSIKTGLKFENFFIEKEPLLLEINTSISKIEFRDIFL